MASPLTALLVAALVAGQSPPADAEADQARQQASDAPAAAPYDPGLSTPPRPGSLRRNPAAMRAGVPVNPNSRIAGPQNVPAPSPDAAVAAPSPTDSATAPPAAPPGSPPGSSAFPARPRPP